MRKPWYLTLMLGVIAMVAVLAACSDIRTRDNDGDEPVTGTPGPQQVDASSAVWSAQKDLADRVGVDVLAIRLADMRAAGWDGCLGVYEPDAACTQQFIGGLIVYFDHGDERYRYHIGGDRFIATDFVPDGWRIDDGLDVPSEISPDMSRVLTAYVRNELAHRLGIDAEEVVVEAVVPAGFSSSCIGFLRRGEEACTDDLVPGVIVLLQAEGEQYRYHAIPSGIRATDFEDGEVTQDYDQAIYDVQQAMRADLAERQGIEAGDVSVVSYRAVTWSDGCIGVYRPGEACTMALVEGFLAFLAAPGGAEYRYHGSGGSFIATDFETGAQINDPMFEQF